MSLSFVAAQCGHECAAWCLHMHHWHMCLAAVLVQEKKGLVSRGFFLVRAGGERNGVPPLSDVYIMCVSDARRVQGVWLERKVNMGIHREQSPGLLHLAFDDDVVFLLGCSVLRLSCDGVCTWVMLAKCPRVLAGMPCVLARLLSTRCDRVVDDAGV